MQYFYWDYPADGMLWNELARNAAELAAAGVTALWLPPPSGSFGLQSPLLKNANLLI